MAKKNKIGARSTRRAATRLHPPATRSPVSREAEARYLRLFHQMADPVFVFDAETLRFLDCNDAACRIYGYAREEFLAITPVALHPDGEKALAQARLREKKWAIREYRHVTKSGRQLTVEISTTDVHYHGRAAHLSIVHDISERVLAQQKLALHVQQTPLGVIEFDPQGRVTAWNPAAERIFGYPEREALGRHASFIVAPESRESCDEVWRQLLSARGTARNTNLNRTRDGRTIICDWYNTTLADAAGEVIGVASLCQDVTKRIHAEEDLQVQKAYLEQLFESAPEGIVLLGSDNRIQRVNQEFTRMFGYSEAELVGQPLDLVVPDDRGNEARFIRQTVEKGLKINVETTRRRKNGALLDVSILGTPIHVSGGQVAVYLICRDITERKRAERALTESESKFRAVAENAASLIYIHDGSRFLYVNRACEEISGYKREELMAMHPLDLLEPGCREEIERDVQARRRGERLEPRHEFTLRTRNGESRWFDATANPIQFEGRTAVLVTGVDVTGRRTLQEQLWQSQKMEAVGRLAGGVAHDFNNLLTVINGYSGLLLEELRASDPMRTEIEEIHKAAERAATLTRQLLAFSRRQVLAPRVLDFNQLVRGTERLLRRLLGEDVELVTRLGDEVGCVRADPGQLEQVLMNLAVNARDAMPRGGKLILETANLVIDRPYLREQATVKPGSYVVLAVSDTGVGMEPEICSHIFEPFFTTKEAGRGTGLGLSTVYGIVKQSGGSIWVSSEPGIGTTFKVCLPRVEDAAEQTQPEPDRLDMYRGAETILVVEDEAGIRAFIRQVLQRHGYKVLECAHGGEALLLCERHREAIHLLLSDVVLPQMNGRELAQRLASLRPEMKVLYMSGYTDEAIAQHGVLTPGSAFLQKPFTIERLTRTIREVLDGK